MQFRSQIEPTPMTVTVADEARVIQLLRQDVAATLGAGYEKIIRDTAVRVRAFRNEPNDYVEKVVEDVQQEFHDLFIDTTWPRCPLHSHHPLWLHDGYWLCEQAHTRVARLGELRADGSTPAA
jgi:hypothetical protein